MANRHIGYKKGEEMEEKTFDQNQEFTNKIKDVLKKYKTRTEREIIRSFFKISVVGCDHIKGNGILSHPREDRTKDHNLSCHTYITGESRIRCHSCGFVWLVDDTQDVITRNSVMMPNPTKWGWGEALEAAKRSSNTFSNSEIPENMITKVRLFSKPAWITDVKKDDKDNE